MEQLSAWVGAGLVTAGVSAALLAGTGVASADPDAGPDSSGSPSSESTGSDTPKPDKPKTDTPDTPKPASTSDEADADDPTDETTPADADGTTTKPTKTSPQDEVRHTSKRKTPAAATPQEKPAATESVTAEPAATSDSVSVSVSVSDAPPAEPIAKAEPVARVAAPQTFSAAAVPAPAPAPLSVLGVVQEVVNAIIVNVGSLVINTVQAIEALVTGPPVVPPGSTVTVRSSTVQLSNGQRVAANWFYPKTETGEPPTKMILLQHGFFALGPMYSYTAANLAETTGSVVVTTTLTSNPFAGDSVWLGGTGTSAAIADLFTGDRAALTASAVDAGYATKYDFGTGPVVLPQKFALIGHSLGANLVSGAAGFLVDNGAADDLVGVILLDGVPIGTTLPVALKKLDAYAESPGGHYIPVREIGAPPNLYNSTSKVNTDLTAARPGRYNGVILDGGVHSDSMRGGNPLIQLSLYIAAGFPLPQNPPAVDSLSAQWFNEWFAGNTSEGDGLIPGTVLDVPTPSGTAHGVVIGDPPAVLPLLGPVDIASSTPSTIPTANPTLATLAA
ncbi:alpha/beta hydrolase [Mycobacterium antarcticum]|uniref:alpha/beta hydrolase n=1 Tax=Mycolicibacterium sp. TUM20983 TaxID=3023369 RepID=UPI0024E13473|nr:alpha/beta hydrolase [Mycolicibacterium sp. TUM20983]